MDAVDRLYRLPPDEFVAARDELARQLRSSGDRDQAADVKGLRRPSVAAWALNQVARQRPDDIEALIDIADELRRAQEQALTGGDADDLRKVSRRRRELVGQLTEVATTILSRTGRDARVQVPGITAILDAAVANPGVADALRSGRLVAEPEPGDLDAFGFLVVAGSTDVDLRDEPADGAARAPHRRPTGRALHWAAGVEEEDHDRMALRKAVGRAQWERDAARRAASETEAALRAASDRAEAIETELEQLRRRLDVLSDTSSDGPSNSLPPRRPTTRRPPGWRRRTRPSRTPGRSSKSAGVERDPRRRRGLAQGRTPERGRHRRHRDQGGAHQPGRGRRDHAASRWRAS